MLDRSAGRVLVLGLLSLVMVGGASADETLFIQSPTQESTKTGSNTLGVRIETSSQESALIEADLMPFQENSGNTVKVSDVSTGTKIFEKTINSENVSFNRLSLDPNTKYDIVITGDRARDFSPGYPRTGSRFDIEAGLFGCNSDGTGCSTTSGVAYNFFGLRLGKANFKPEFKSTSVSPDPLLIGETADFSYSASDPDGNISSVNLSLKDDGTQVFTASKSTSSGTFSPPDTLTEGDINATFTATDNKGATTTETLTRTLTDTKPVVNISQPSGTVFDYDQSFSVDTKDDGDNNVNEQLSCVLDLDSSQIDQRTVTEGDNYTVNERADLGSHSASVKCTEQDDNQNDSGSTSFTVEDFRIDSVSSASNVFETENVSYSLSFSQGAIVNQEGSSVKLFYGDDSESYSFDPKAAQTQSFRNLVPLVSGNSSVKDWRIQATYNASKFSGGTELRQANSSVKSQNVFFNYHSPSLNPSKTDMIERQEFSVTTDVVNEIGDEKADLSFRSSFEGETKTGKQSSFVFPLVQNTNKTSLPVSGSVEISFKGETETRQASPVSLTGYRKVLTDCSTGLDTAKALDISVFDEKNRTSLKSQIGWEFSVSANGHSRSFQFNKTASATQNCIYPDFAQYQVSGDVFYESPEKVNSKDVSYPGRIYTVTGDTLDNDTSSLDLYLLSERFATPVSYKVIDSARSAVEDVELSVQKYFSETNSFVTVAQLKTGDDGTDTSFIETNDIYYRHVLSQGNKTLKSSDREPFFCSSVPCQKTFQIGATGIDSFFTEKEGFEFRCGKTFENGNVSGFECEVGHNGDLMENASLNMFRQDPIGETQICSAEGTSNQMTLICPLNETEGESFEFALEASTSGETYTLKTGVLDFTTNLTGTKALFPAFVVFLAFSMLGLITPKVSIIFSTAGFLVAYGFGFVGVSTAAVGSIVAVALFMVITSET